MGLFIGSRQEWELHTTSSPAPFLRLPGQHCWTGVDPLLSLAVEGDWNWVQLLIHAGAAVASVLIMALCEPGAIPLE